MLPSLRTVSSARGPLLSFQDRSDAWPTARAVVETLSDFATMAQGVLTGTMVATDRGWRPVETLATGDGVLTFDHGLRKLAAHTARPLNRDPRSGDAGWGLFVPNGVLGNRAPMTLLAGQMVLIDCAYGVQHYGDPFVLVPAGLLTGFKGISRVALADDMQNHMLAFDEPEIVHSEGSALLACFAARRSHVRSYPIVTWGESAAFRANLLGQACADTQHPLPYAPAWSLPKGDLSCRS